jgi:hypothetical protein
MLLGGIKNGIQRFDRKQAGNYSVLLALTFLPCDPRRSSDILLGDEGFNLGLKLSAWVLPG